ncbi:MAG: DoxX family protein [Bacteroidales bacterium]|jgi:hypothetical protein|nr:DoxX family protein [Bacteroidales bacterium]
MKKDKIIFWIATVIVSGMMLFAAFGYLTNEQIKGGFVHLGFPSYFRVELGVAKGLGAIALLLPMLPVRLKDFVYSGFAITFISAFIAHISSGDPFSVAINPVIFLGVLVVSYIYLHKMRDVQTVRENESQAK